MRNLPRLLVAAVVVAVSLLSAVPSESSCVTCVEEGNCIVCYDCWGFCTYSCTPGGDGYC